MLLLIGTVQYNETTNDLLGTGELDKKKHEIRHDGTSTRVTDINVIPLHPATQVRSFISLAKSRKTIAVTLMKPQPPGKDLASGNSCKGSLTLSVQNGSRKAELGMTRVG